MDTVGGVVIVSDRDYDAGRSAPFSLTTKGELRVAFGGSAPSYQISTNCTRTMVPSAIATTILASANAGRRALRIRNSASTILHICPGNADATAMTAEEGLIPGGVWSAPDNFIGAVQGIWSDVGDGGALVAEYV